jgi:hypothetical protein
MYKYKIICLEKINGFYFKIVFHYISIVILYVFLSLFSMLMFFHFCFCPLCLFLFYFLFFILLLSSYINQGKDESFFIFTFSVYILPCFFFFGPLL